MSSLNFAALGKVYNSYAVISAVAQDISNNWCMQGANRAEPLQKQNPLLYINNSSSNKNFNY